MNGKKIIYCSENILKNKDIFPDRPAGLLDRYRNKATFDYRKLTLIFYDEKCLTFRVSENNLIIKN